MNMLTLPTTIYKGTKKFVVESQKSVKRQMVEDNEVTSRALLIIFSEASDSNRVLTLSLF